MANIQAKNASNAKVFVKAAGMGTDQDPHVPYNRIQDSSGNDVDPATVDSIAALQTQMAAVPGFNIPAYDYIGVNEVENGDNTETTYIYKTGGASGTTVATVVEIKVTATGALVSVERTA